MREFYHSPISCTCNNSFSSEEDMEAMVSTYRTQGWKETSSKSLGLTKLMVRSGMPVSFTEQSMYPWISVDTVLPDLSMMASTLAEDVRINQPI